MSVRLCTDPYAILPININECVGQSLNTINAYYNIVQENICLQYDEVVELQNGILALSAEVYPLSADVVNFPKAYVSFSGVLSTNLNTLEIFNSYNVSTVAAIASGVYEIRFSTNFATAGYGAIATSSNMIPPTNYGRAVIGTSNYTVSSVRVQIENNNGIITTNKPVVVAVTVFA
jgi:hypothetical protein